jgi:hypothetical protein
VNKLAKKILKIKEMIKKPNVKLKEMVEAMPVKAKGKKNTTWSSQNKKKK